MTSIKLTIQQASNLLGISTSLVTRRGRQGYYGNVWEERLEDANSKAGKTQLLVSSLGLSYAAKCSFSADQLLAAVEGRAIPKAQVECYKRRLFDNKKKTLESLAIILRSAMSIIWISKPFAPQPKNINKALRDFSEINGDGQIEEEEKPVEPSGADRAWQAAKGIFKPFARQPPKELFIPMLDMAGHYFEFIGATHLQRFDMPKARNGYYRVQVVDALGQKHMVSSRAVRAALGDKDKAREHAYHANELQARQVHGFGSGLRGIDPSEPPKWGRHARQVYAAARRVFGADYREDENDPWAAARIK